ncbi:MAG: hypothetical protein GF334_05415 [Candidatus Altiarchaeales archaeon]|nr:hypothetical protein [Candidatus Altiarchaeales archaeon]
MGSPWLKSNEKRLRSLLKTGGLYETHIVDVVFGDDFYVVQSLPQYPDVDTIEGTYLKDIHIEVKVYASTCSDFLTEATVPLDVFLKQSQSYTYRVLQEIDLPLYAGWPFLSRYYRQALSHLSKV